MSITNYKPTFARVLIARDVEEKKGSIMIPAHLQQRHARSEGTVVAVGPTADETITVGSRVVFGKHAGTWLDKTYTIMPESNTSPFFLCQDEDILLVIEQDDSVDVPAVANQIVNFDDKPTAASFEAKQLNITPAA